jgi:hypothetical protein
LSGNLELNRVQPSLGWEVRISRELVEIVRALMEHVGDWRPMRHLLHVDFATIRKRSLVCFTQNGIQGFIKTVTISNKRDWTKHDVFHSFYGVLSQSSCIKVSGSKTSNRCDDFDNCFVIHHANW